MFDTLSSALMVFKLVCTVVPKSICSSMHNFHFIAKAMIAIANKQLWWPQVNSHITSKWANCLRCQQFMWIKNPLVPVCEQSYQICEMEQLSANYFSIGHQHYHGG